MAAPLFDEHPRDRKTSSLLVRLEGKEKRVRVECKRFPAFDATSGLESCARESFEPVFMPSLVRIRMNNLEGFRKNGGKGENWQNLYCWGNWFSTRSVVMTGMSRQHKRPLVVYAHVPTYLSDWRNLQPYSEKVYDGTSAIVPEKEFYRVLDLDGNGKVFVLNYKAVKKARVKSYVRDYIVSVEQALEDPLTLPFMGVNEAEAIAYFAQHEEVYGDYVGLLHNIDVAKQPIGRFLHLGHQESMREFKHDNPLMNLVSSVGPGIVWGPQAHHFLGVPQGLEKRII